MSSDAAGGWLPLVVVVDPCWSGEASGQAALQKNLPPSALLPPDRPVRCAHQHDEAITHTQAARRAVASIASPACSYRHGHLLAPPSASMSCSVLASSSGTQARLGE